MKKKKKKTLASKIKDVDNELQIVKEAIALDVLKVVHDHMGKNGLNKWGIKIETRLTNTSRDDDFKVHSFVVSFHL